MANIFYFRMIIYTYILKNNNFELIFWNLVNIYVQNGYKTNKVDILVDSLMFTIILKY